MCTDTADDGQLRYKIYTPKMGLALCLQMLRAGDEALPAEVALSLLCAFADFDAEDRRVTAACAPPLLTGGALPSLSASGNHSSSG